MDRPLQRRRQGRRGLAAIALAVGLGALCAAPAGGEGPSRAEYVATLERACKPGALATQRVMKGARADVRADRLRVAAAKFAQASRIFAGTVRRIDRVPRPSADRARLRRWFVYLNRQSDYLRRITAHLRGGRAIKAQRLTARFIHSGNLANNVVLAFGFDHCSFKFSRYG